MAPPIKTLSLTRRAEIDLSGIYDHTAETWSARQAKLYTDSLYAAFKDLASGAQIGRDDGLGDGRKRISVGVHVVFYRTTEESIIVVRVLHQAMDFPHHLGA